MSNLFIAIQFLLPQHLLTALIWRVARIRHVATKNFLITQFANRFRVNLDEVRNKVPDEFPTFNDFFIRELRTGARPIDNDSAAIVSPVDGSVSIAGKIETDSIVQAKGINYSLADLLATDLEQADAYIDGNFATIYLAPYNYHRVHSPFAGELLDVRYIPGDLFSVNQATVARVSGLFRRNERLVMHFATQFGQAAVIFVGALNVGSISTPWTGEIRPKKNGVVEIPALSNNSKSIGKGDLLGWFNMGSTVILLMPPGAGSWGRDLQPGQAVQVGEAIGELAATTE